MDRLVYRFDWKTKQEDFIVMRDTIVVKSDGTIEVLKAGTVVSAPVPVEGSLKVSARSAAEEPCSEGVDT